MASRRPPGETATAAIDTASFQRALLGHLPGVIWAADTDLCCRFASPQARSGLGLGVGAPVTAPASDESAAFLASHREALAGGAAGGRLTLAGATFSYQVEPLRDAEGAVIGVIGSAEETTGRDRAARLVEAQMAALAAAVEHAPEGIAVCDATGRFLLANAASRRFAERHATGTPIADGDAVWGVWYDDCGRLTPEQWPIARALRGELVPATDVHKIKPDGTREYMQIAAVPLRDDAGAIIGAAATAIDVTARKLAEEQVREINERLERRVRERTAELEEAIRERDREADERRHALDLLTRSEQLLRDVIEHSTAVIFLKDLEGRYLLINEHYRHLFALGDDQWMGRSDHEFFPREVADTLRANDRRVVESGTAMQVEEVVPTQGRDRTYLVVKFPLRGRDGAIYGVCGMATDITEQKELEATLRRSQATLASLIESSSDPICALDRRWRLVAINQAAARLIPLLTGSAPRLHEAFADPPEEFAGPWRELFRLCMNGERLTVERAVTVDGVARPFLVSFNPTVQDGAVTGVAVFGREITDLRHAEEEARQHQAELAHVLRRHTMGEIAASLAHEVNQPLGAIANYAQGCRNRLTRGRIDRGELLAAVEEIAREALRAGEITRRVRELLRKEEVRHVTADAAEIVRAALGIAAATARRQQVALASSLDPSPLPVHVDPIQIEQVVLNLVLNAIEATTASTTRAVEVRATATARADEAVEIAVRDTGAGIDPRLEQRIFEPFVTTKPGGLGMGLAISRSIVAAHGGRLWYARNEGGGTTFHFTLPAAPQG